MKGLVFYSKVGRCCAVIAFVLLSVGSVEAQWSHLYYHRTGDTIKYDSPIYYHNWWEYENSYQNHFFTVGPTGNHYPNERKLLSYCFTDEPMEIIGVAIAKPTIVPVTGEGGLIEWPDTTPKQEYVLIYEALPDTLMEVASAPWHVSDPARLLYIRGRGHYDIYVYDPRYSCCVDEPWSKYIGILEYYFDNPIIVNDSFYVGRTCNSAIDTSDFITFENSLGTFMHQEITGRHSPVYSCKEGEDEYECDFTWPTVRYGFQYAPTGGIARDTVYRYSDFVNIPVIFPIIRVDTTVPPADYCPPVENVHIENAGGGSVNVTWDAFVNHQYGYEVRFGARNMPPSQWENVYTDINMLHLEGLNTGLFYALYVRPYCDEEGSVGLWCDTVYFQPTDSVDVSIDITPLARHTRVVPNPARETVTMQSDYVILQVDVYDSKGQHVLNIAKSGKQVTADITSLSAGQYTLMVKTPNGVTPKTLLVVR